jgi:hypothetical protein
MVQAIRTINVLAASLRAGDRIVHNGEITALLSTVDLSKDRATVRVVSYAGDERTMAWNDHVTIAEKSR